MGASPAGDARDLADTVDAMPRTRTLAIAGALVLAACSGGGDDVGGTPATAPSTTASAGVSAGASAGRGAVESSDAPAPDDARAAGIVPQWSVSIDVAAEGLSAGSVEASVGWTGDPDDVVDDGPFGAYASCSGLRDSLGPYSVFVSGSDDVDLVGVWTSSRVDAPGIYDAEVRIERAGLAPLTASGTMTILDGLQAGEFLAFGADGGSIEGTFSCSGSEPPSPLRAGTSGAVEVFALLRTGDAERIVGLTTDEVGTAACRRDGGVVLAVEGDATIGTITAIELDMQAPTSARLRVAGTEYEFADVTVMLDEGTGVSGVFSAVDADGGSVDGAFRCT